MTDDMDQNLEQDEIERLLQQTQGRAAETAARAPAGAEAGDEATPAEGVVADASDAAADDMSGDLSQDEIEKLFQRKGVGQGKSTSEETRDREDPAPADSSHEPDPDVQLLLNQAEEALRSVDDPAESDVPGLSPFAFKQLTGAPANTDRASLDLLRDVELEMRVELGRTHMYLEDVLQLRKGSVVPLDKMAGDPVDVYVNGRLVARGEVLVLNENFCVRIAELISGEELEQRESA